MRTYLKDPEKVMRRNAEWVSRNKERARATARAGAERNRDKLRSKYAADRLDPLKKAKARAAVRAHYARNREMYLAKDAKRRAQKKSATPPWYGEFDNLVMNEAFQLAKIREALTGTSWEVDHVYPLVGRKVCGLHVGNNVQVIPAALNKAKGNMAILTATGAWLRHI